MSAPVISIRNVSKRFGSLVAVDDVSIDIEENEFFALLGPSGCGKTTLLRMIAGFSNPDEGQIFIDGKDMSLTPPNQRPVNMVFQSYAVFPHMNVTRNVAYGLEMERTDARQITARVGEILERVGLTQFANNMPEQLSGGQRQRVALARALVKRPKVLLLDEPLSALDAKLREQMQMELANLQIDVGVTFVTVTHDQDEALSMADRIAVMRDGKVEQIAGPDILYENPANKFVADFIGRINLFNGSFSGATKNQVRVDTSELGKVSLPSKNPINGDVILAIRPEKIRIGKTKSTAADDIICRGRITDWAYYGDNSHMKIQCKENFNLGVVIQNNSRRAVDNLDIGDDVYLSWSPQDMLILND